MKKRHLLKLLIASMAVCATMAFAGEGGAVKGNKSSRIYHKPACKHYASKGSTEAFASEAAARKAGFKACKQCGKANATKKADAQKKK
jgi:methylphosphotriester-DNA--protein-cysteine methyltransferase